MTKCVTFMKTKLAPLLKLAEKIRRLWAQNERREKTVSIYSSNKWTTWKYTPRLTTWKANAANTNGANAHNTFDPGGARLCGATGWGFLRSKGISLDLNNVENCHTFDSRKEMINQWSSSSGFWNKNTNQL